jgi:cytochrome P450
VAFANSSYRFAQRELRLVLGTVLRRYKIGLVGGQSLDFVQYTVPAFTAGHYFVTIEPRS